MVKLMDIPSTDTTVAGGGAIAALTALFNTFWQRWSLGRKFEKIEGKLEAVRLEAKVRLDGHDQEIETHAIYDAQTYIPRAEFSNVIQNLDRKLDSKFDSLNSNIITAIRDGNGK